MELGAWCCSGFHRIHFARGGAEIQLLPSPWVDRPRFLPPSLSEERLPPLGLYSWTHFSAAEMWEVVHRPVSFSWNIPFLQKMMRRWPARPRDLRHPLHPC